MLMHVLLKTEAKDPRVTSWPTVYKRVFMWASMVQDNEYRILVRSKQENPHLTSKL